MTQAAQGRPRSPETEDEFWNYIEALGGITWQIEHDHADGRPSFAGDISGVAKLRKQQEDLVAEACERFNIIHPHNPPDAIPEGATPYWDWYKGMKTNILGEEYDQIVCSSCAFVESKAQHISRGGGHVPCSIFPGRMGLNVRGASFRCEYVGHNQSWDDMHPASVEELLQMLLDQHGQYDRDRLAERLRVAQCAWEDIKKTTTDHPADGGTPPSKEVRSEPPETSG